MTRHALSEDRNLTLIRSETSVDDGDLRLFPDVYWFALRLEPV
ncbi:MAG: hypothetical protein P1V34_03680 [Alphaproteobacteria bacterium]|nr:hypothetical protein [Alphaproteobacteria bacterium]